MHERSRDGIVDTSAVRKAVRAYVARHCERTKPSSLARAKRALERHFDCDLSMAHVCDEAALHPETFARQFKATYGLTPAAYRIRLRVNHAARLCWSRPDLSIAEIGREVGFANRAYFHRAFLCAFEVTPAQARTRWLLDDVRVA